MPRQPFTFYDILQECRAETGCHLLSDKKMGARIIVPAELHAHYPYNGTAYGFLQQLRQEIQDFGTIEFPDLPVNRLNHTVAMRSPKEHAYSTNPYLTDTCQRPHQDTPPYPTAFWLDEPRRYYATWLLSLPATERFYTFMQANPDITMEEAHRLLVPESLNNGTAILVNRQPGLLLMDNSDYHSLFHARTSNFEAINSNPGFSRDVPLYTFNEVGLLNYMDIIDSRRGKHDRDAKDLAAVIAFLKKEAGQPGKRPTIH